MKNIALLVSCATIIIGWAACKSNDAVNPATQKLNVAYGLGERQVMDVYLPQDYARGSKVVFILHGGGFVAGAKSDFTDVAKQFRDKGFVAVNVEYNFIDTSGLNSLPPAHINSTTKVLNQLEDLDAAIKKYKKMAPEWGVGDSRIYVAGHSIGALIAMLYTQSDYNEARIVRASANWAGITDLAIPHDSVLTKLDPRYIELMYRATGVMPGVDRNLSFMAISPIWTIQNNNCFPVISVLPDNNSVLNMPGETQWNYLHTKQYHDSVKSRYVAQKMVVLDSTNHLFTTPKNRWSSVVEETANFFSTH